MGAADLWITEDRVSGSDIALFAQDPLDDYAFATGQALRFQRDPPRGEQLALIGTAAMREALIADDEISARLTQTLGRPIPVIDFMSGGQSGIEMAALAESLGRDFHGIVVLGVSFSRLAADSSELAGLVREPRLALNSAAGDAEIRAAGFEVPPRTGNYLFDHYKFFVARYRAILWHLISGNRPVHQSRTYLGRPTATPAQWASDAAILRARITHYDARADENLGAMERLLHLFPDRSKVRIVLLEIPVNPRAVNSVLGRNFIEHHRARMQAFADQQGVAYWDLNQSTELSAADFQDWGHINSEVAQERWSGQLLQRLGPLLSTQ